MILASKRVFAFVQYGYADTSYKVLSTIRVYGVYMSQVPRMKVLRKIVEAIEDSRDRVLIEMLYLTACRVNEISMRALKYDVEHKKSRALGAHLSYELTKYQEHPVFLLQPAVLKRKLKPTKRNPDPIKTKAIALPCNPDYEPWTYDLMDWVKQHKILGFPITRVGIWQIIKKRLSCLDPGIRTHDLRHYRITHLITEYEFDAFDLTAYAGWTVRHGLAASGMGSFSGQLDVYGHLSWRRYFPKLLREVS